MKRGFLAEACWGWRTIVERTLGQTLTPSSTILLSPDLEQHTLYLVWALISFSPRHIGKTPVPELQCESALYCLLLL